MFLYDHYGYIQVIRYWYIRVKLSFNCYYSHSRELLLGYAYISYELICRVCKFEVLRELRSADNFVYQESQVNNNRGCIIPPSRQSNKKI